MLAARLGVSAILIPAFIGLCVADHRLGEPAWYLLGLCLLLATRSAYELGVLLSVRNFRPVWVPSALSSLAIVASLWVARSLNPVGTGWDSLSALGLPCAVFAIAVLLLCLIEMARYSAPGNSMESFGANVVSVVYIGLLLTLTAQLRWVAGAQAGYFVLASLVICVKMGDTGAYTFGRLWGKRKMAPVLSPGKTWMGFVGALVGSALGAILWLRFGIRLFSDEWTPPPILWSIVYGVILGVVGLLGDLFESLIKRDVGRKDAPAFLPGFGGLLDLLDSILYAGPVAYLLWIVLPLVTW